MVMFIDVADDEKLDEVRWRLWEIEHVCPYAIITHVFACVLQDFWENTAVDLH